MNTTKQKPLIKPPTPKKQDVEKQPIKKDDRKVLKDRLTQLEDQRNYLYEEVKNFRGQLSFLNKEYRLVYKQLADLERGGSLKKGQTLFFTFTEDSIVHPPHLYNNCPYQLKFTKGTEIRVTYNSECESLYNVKYSSFRTKSIQDQSNQYRRYISDPNKIAPTSFVVWKCSVKITDGSNEVKYPKDYKEKEETVCGYFNEAR